MTPIAVRAVVIALIPMVVLSGCTTMTVAGSQPHEVVRKVEVGSKVRIITKDGQRHLFKVTQMTSDSISGKEVQVSYDDIAQVEVKELDVWRTVVVVGKVGLATYGAVMLTALAAGLVAYTVTP